MNAFYFILLLLGAVCFFISASGTATPRRVNVQSLGLLFWIAVPLIQAFKVL